MTEAESLLAQLTDLGVLVRREGADLVLSPADHVPRTLVPVIREHKAALLALLDGPKPETRPEPPPQAEKPELLDAQALWLAAVEQLADVLPADVLESCRCAQARWASPDEELEESLAALSDESSELFHAAVAARRAAGEPEPGLLWRALVDVRLSRRGKADGWPGCAQHADRPERR